MDILISGTIVLALPIQQGVSQRTGNAWQRAQYIIEHESGQYPKRMVFDVSGNKIQELNLQVGEQVTLHLNISCREYPEGSGKWFNSIEAWKAERSVQQQAMPQGQMQQPVQQMPPQQMPPQQMAQPQYQQAPAQSPFPQQQMPPQQPAPGAAPFPPQQPQAPQSQPQGLPF